MHSGAQSEAKSVPAADQSTKGNVLITGANRGIGLALAQHFKAAGYQVIGTARTPAEAKELAESGARVMQLDVTDAKSVRALAEALKDQPIDILVNNAGITGSRGSIDALDIDAVERVLAVNTIGPMRLTQALLPNLRAAPRKVVISISSGLGSLAGNTSGGHYGYRESKAAINMFMRSIAADLKDEGFTCVAMSPGWVRTDMGGPQATLSPADSAAGIVKVIESLKTSDSGTFHSHDGKEVAW
ncbi:MAG: SDR family oxidoreductase [Phycisphaerae bacterium]|nr:SDR family oxidoreductase [Phycisphaerae bacterium]